VRGLRGGEEGVSLLFSGLEGTRSCCSPNPEPRTDPADDAPGEEDFFAGRGLHRRGADRAALVGGGSWGTVPRTGAVVGG